MMTPEQCRADRFAATAHVQLELPSRPTAIPTHITGKLVRIFRDNGNSLRLSETVIFPAPLPSPGAEPKAEAWARARYIEAYLNRTPSGWQSVPGQLTLMRDKSSFPINPADSVNFGVPIGPDLWAAPAGAPAIVVSPPTVSGVFRDHWNELDRAKRVAYILMAILFIAFALGSLVLSAQPAVANAQVYTPQAPRETATHTISLYRAHLGDAPSGLIFRNLPQSSGTEGAVVGLLDCQPKRQLHLSLAFDQSNEPGLTYYGREWRLQGRPIDLYINLDIDGKIFRVPGASVISSPAPMRHVVGAVAFYNDDLAQALASAHRIKLRVGNSRVSGLISSPSGAMKQLAAHCAQ
jgi:hypothetical protein